MMMNDNYKIYIYNENCTMKGRSVPQGIIEEYDGDPDDGGDWTVHEGSTAELLDEARIIERHARTGGGGQYDRQVARTIAEAIGVELDD